MVVWGKEQFYQVSIKVKGNGLSDFVDSAKDFGANTVDKIKDFGSNAVDKAKEVGTKAIEKLKI